MEKFTTPPHNSYSLYQVDTTFHNFIDTWQIVMITILLTEMPQTHFRPTGKTPAVYDARRTTTTVPEHAALACLALYTRIGKNTYPPTNTTVHN